MKTSKYIYIVPFDTNRSLFFNGISKRFFITNNEDVDSYLRILSLPNDYGTVEKDRLNTLSMNRFILNDNVNELEILAEGRTAVVDSSLYKMIIVPTYDCNYRCWYCTQKHEKAVLPKEKLELIKKHVTTYLEENNIEVYTLSWFGGEPLMEPQTIEDLSSYLLQYCKLEKAEERKKLTISFKDKILIEDGIMKAPSVMKLEFNDNKLIDINYFEI